MSDSKTILLLNKIKHKIIIFENIQGYILHRHYILPFLLENDKVLKKQLKNIFHISKKNILSSNLMNNIYTFVSDMMLYNIANEEDIMDNSNQYLDEKENEKEKKDSIFKIYQNRIAYIYKNCKYYYNYNTSKISNSILENFLPNDKDFSLFILDILSLQKTLNKKYEIKQNIYKILSEQQNSINKEYVEDISFYKNKININLVFIGMVHAGKSTSIGHLLYSTNSINLDDFIKIKKTTEEWGLYTFRYAWLADKSKQERETCHTNNTSHRKLETEKYYFSLIDVPGKTKYIKNAIKGIFQGDVAIIVVPADKDNFEKMFSDNESFKDQIITAYIMGIKHAIVAINKMDLCNYSKERYFEIKEKIQKFLDKIGYDDVKYVCYSGITGQNLVNRYEDDDKLKINHTPWYKGKTLLEELEQLKQPVRPINKPLRIKIFDTKKVTGIGWIIIGIIKTGLLKKGMPISLSVPVYYNNQEYFCIKGKCASIQKHGIDLDIAIPGDIVSIRIQNLSKYLLYKDLKRIYTIGNYENLSAKVNNFIARITVMNVPNSIKVGFCPLMFCNFKMFKIKFINLLYKIDGRTNKIIEHNPKEIKNGEKAIVLLEPYLEKSKNFLISEKYFDHSFFGGFIIKDNNKIIAVGKIKEINIIDSDHTNVLEI